MILLAHLDPQNMFSKGGVPRIQKKSFTIIAFDYYLPYKKQDKQEYVQLKRENKNIKRMVLE